MCLFVELDRDISDRNLAAFFLLGQKIIFSYD